MPTARLYDILRDGRDVANSLVTAYNVLSDDVLRTACGGPRNEHPLPDPAVPRRLDGPVVGAGGAG